MRKSILLAEFFRISELLQAHENSCPVCAVSQDLKQRFNGKDCCSGYKSACHPKVQERCKAVMKQGNIFTESMHDSLAEIEEDIWKLYKIHWRDLYILYQEWRKTR